MVQDEPPATLYDFLYKDSSRITSYYAQLFGGSLETHEHSDSTTEGEERTGKLSAGVFGGDVKTSSQTQVGAKRVINPHDVVTTDVLAFLSGKSLLQKDVGLAPHGSLIVAQGTLCFLDKLMIELAVASFEMTVKQEMAKPKAQRDMLSIQTMNFVIPFLSKLIVPSAFLLETDDGVQLAGTLKDEGMQEPISTYYFKHGTGGLGQTFVIGIKEEASVGLTLIDEQFFGASQLAAQALSAMFFPAGSIKLTPIALFRKLF